MKVAVNKCFGGFDLSLKAQKRILELKGLPFYAYEQTKYRFQDGKDLFERVNENEERGFRIIYVFTKDKGDSFYVLPEDDYWSKHDIERTDSELIKAIEELGEEASGMCGNIQVVEIPDGIEWEIDDYDGLETIHEVHRSW